MPPDLKADSSPPPGPSGQRAGLRPLLLSGLAVVGLGLAAVPWLLPGRPMRLPAVIEQGSPGYAALLAVARRVDAACAKGDVGRLRQLVTAGQWQRMAAWLKDAGRSLDAAALVEQRHLVGDLGELPFLCGASAGASAVLVFYRSRPGLGADRGSLFALIFAWDGVSFLLHHKRSEALGPEDDAAARAETWAAELLLVEAG